MPLASLRCRPARFDDERLNQQVKIDTLKKLRVLPRSTKPGRLTLAARKGYSVLLHRLVAVRGRTCARHGGIPHLHSRTDVYVLLAWRGS